MLLAQRLLKIYHLNINYNENGFGKRTEVEKYRLIGRGGKGVTTLKITEKTGSIINAFQVKMVMILYCYHLWQGE
ncbi:hypothetical protein CM15mP43_10660 [bacterium]|nr:MAG: hypothetical protein CM15mP43_10660 [bacterium]